MVVLMVHSKSLNNYKRFTVTRKLLVVLYNIWLLDRVTMASSSFFVLLSFGGFHSCSTTYQHYCVIPFQQGQPSAVMSGSSISPTAMLNRTGFISMTRLASYWDLGQRWPKDRGQKIITCKLQLLVPIASFDSSQRTPE